MIARADAMTSTSPRRTRVLVIDDDERLNALLTRYMDRFGFSVSSSTDPRSGLRMLKSDPPEIVILDVMLPEMDGFAVCRKVRETSRIPIIMLTARGELMDRILGLDTFYINAMLLLVTFGVGTGRVVYFEAALVIGMIGFVATVALAKFLIRGEVIE